MPIRIVPLISGQYYHIFNRGINKQPIFLQKSDYARMLHILHYYMFASPRLRFSKFLLLSNEQRSLLLQQLEDITPRLIEIHSFCLMPNHFHFLLKQVAEDGISKVLSNIQNSYTRYFNTKYEKFGPILQGQFKAVRVEDDDQLIHLSRYIHLNPYTSYVVKKKEEIVTYPWSSMSAFSSHIHHPFCQTETVLSFFKNTSYQQFVLDNTDYQRELGRIKHMLLE